ncbi:MAG: hypothetical protein ACRDL2_09890 [Gaiellaceae bacterium]
MSAEAARTLERTRREERTETLTVRMRVVLALGPLTSVAGLGWAIAQPWRLTLLHPYGQGFWWLVAEPPLYVAAAGLLFWRFVARGLVADLVDSER